MTNGSAESDARGCGEVLAALARGGEDTDWAAIEQHLAGCTRCATGMELLTTAINEQFAASASLDDAALAAPDAIGQPSRIVQFPAAAIRSVAPVGRWRGRRGLTVFGGLAAAVLILLVGALVVSSRTGGRGGVVQADRRPEFVPSLQVLPQRPDNTYFSGEQVQVCLRINQPSRIHLSVIEGHATFDLYDADTDPGQHCFPERVTALRGPAMLRVEVFYGQERVAREDFPLRPATPTVAPPP